MDLKNKTAFISGGAVRIGRAIALALAQKGCHIVIHYNRSAKEAAALTQELEKIGVTARTVHAELNSEAACTKAIQDAGPIDILINNAAVFNKHLLAEITSENLLAEFWPNLFAPIFLTQAFTASTKTGKIINFADRRITTHDPSCLPYHLTKCGVAEFTKTVALELAPRFTVNAIAPGAILPPPGEDETYLKEHAPESPLATATTLLDITNAVTYLLESDVITGQIIYVDSGSHLNVASDC